MSYIHVGGYDENAKPSRPLRADFTSGVLRNAVKAKQRSTAKRQFQSLVKEPFSMKSIKFLRTVPGAALAFALVVTGSVGVGAYTLSNWFGGDVHVSQDTSIFSVDLSSCKGNFPPGVEPQDDSHNIKFKIMGNPHISADDLQRHLLAECEDSAVTDFYGEKFPTAGLSSTGHPSSIADYMKYLLLPATITNIDGNSITLTSTAPKGSPFSTRTFTLSPDLSVYDKGQPSSLSSLQKGDNVMFLAYSASNSTVNETTSVLDASDVQVLSLFKTQYNDGLDSSLDYIANNVLPLDSYNQLPNGKPYK